VPQYAVDLGAFDIPRNAVVIDTNVLCARFLPGDDCHANAVLYLEEEPDYFPIVLSAVVVETWGMIVGSRKAWDCGLELLDWLGQPGRVLVVPHNSELLERARGLTREFSTRNGGIDLVDAMLACFAGELSDKCSFRPPVPIMTTDTSDFLRMYEKQPVRLLDLRTGDTCP
jgi:predicted nucleic acid-binding protein